MKNLGKIMSNAVVDSDGCWIWQGEENSNGYGIYYYKNQWRFVHCMAYHFSWENLAGTEIKQTCGKKKCVNPMHLEVLACDS